MPPAGEGEQRGSSGAAVGAPRSNSGSRMPPRPPPKAAAAEAAAVAGGMSLAARQAAAVGQNVAKFLQDLEIEFHHVNDTRPVVMEPIHEFLQFFVVKEISNIRKACSPGGGLIEAPGFHGPEIERAFSQMEGGEDFRSGYLDFVGRIERACPGELPPLFESLRDSLQDSDPDKGALIKDIRAILTASRGAPRLTARHMRAIAAAGYFGPAQLSPLARLAAADYPGAAAAAAAAAIAAASGPHSSGPHSSGPSSGSGPHSSGPHSSGPHSSGPHSSSGPASTSGATAAGSAVVLPLWCNLVRAMAAAVPVPIAVRVLDTRAVAERSIEDALKWKWSRMDGVVSSATAFGRGLMMNTVEAILDGRPATQPLSRVGSCAAMSDGHDGHEGGQGADTRGEEAYDPDVSKNMVQLWNSKVAQQEATASLPAVPSRPKGPRARKAEAAKEVAAPPPAAAPAAAASAAAAPASAAAAAATPAAPAERTHQQPAAAEAGPSPRPAAGGVAARIKEAAAQQKRRGSGGSGGGGAPGEVDEAAARVDGGPDSSAKKGGCIIS